MNLLFDSLHTHSGLLIFFTAVVVFRNFRSTALPLLCVIVFEVVVLWGGLTGETSDAQVALGKFLSAIIWPFVIVTLGRLRLLELLMPSDQTGANDTVRPR